MRTALICVHDHIAVRFACSSEGKPLWFQACQHSEVPHRRRIHCHGYVIDHIVPLKHGGADAPDNMQCQTKAEAKAEDRVE
jgi:hypothetical protein